MNISANKNTKPRESARWEPGNHTVTIKDIKLARTKYGAPIVSKKGNCPKIEVVLRSVKTGETISYFFFDTPKTKWISKMICEAAGVKFSEELDVETLKGKPCVASVRNVFYTEDGINEMKDTTGVPITTVEVFDLLHPENAPEELAEDRKKFYRAAAELKWYQ